MICLPALPALSNGGKGSSGLACWVIHTKEGEVKEKQIVGVCHVKVLPGLSLEFDVVFLLDSSRQKRDQIGICAGMRIHSLWRKMQPSVTARSKFKPRLEDKTPTSEWHLRTPRQVWGGFDPSGKRVQGRDVF